uniref:Uncharacterized protein n=1 Tax=Klebsiella pneumoniae TaxID=573 RepID=A0A8B0SVZ7_KLEPN|nr:hypothetical protein [Klebsiella pneumoniae]
MVTISQVSNFFIQIQFKKSQMPHFAASLPLGPKSGERAASEGMTTTEGSSEKQRFCSRSIEGEIATENIGHFAITSKN